MISAISMTTSRTLVRNFCSDFYFAHIQPNTKHNYPKVPLRARGLAPSGPVLSPAEGIEALWQIGPVPASGPFSQSFEGFLCRANLLAFAIKI